MFLVAAANQTTARALSSSLSCNDMIVVGTATTSSELETALHLRSDIDVLVTDVLISGVQTSLIYAPIVAQRPELNVLCYTFRSEPAYVMTAIRCGALGYVLRNTSEDLANCVRLIKGGGSPMSPAITRHVLRAMQLKSVKSILRVRQIFQTYRIANLKFSNCLRRGSRSPTLQPS